jgi:uncharacterized repeat protein (TIGR03806 family)
MKKGFVILILACTCLANFRFTKPRLHKNLKALGKIEIKEKLSEYGFFEGKLSDLKPIATVLPYELNMPLFSDYAVKRRFVRLPDGEAAVYNPDSTFQFPIGTVLIKNFIFPFDLNHPEKGQRIVETRLLLQDGDGWNALPYIWNEAQTEAVLEPVGDTKSVSFKDLKGQKKTFAYDIPNINQCRDCHVRFDKLGLIGPTARQLNGDFNYAEGIENQLIAWKKRGILRGVPETFSTIPKLPSLTDKAASLDAKARAYLDINCAHCHNRHGQAFTSGMFLDWKMQDSTALGFNKSPVAAGRGSGNRKYAIVKGKPHESILVYRMSSTDAGEMMPELARKLTHTEGVDLIREWIKSMR